jgi:hypothetical protein
VPQYSTIYRNITPIVWDSLTVAQKRIRNYYNNYMNKVIAFVGIIISLCIITGCLLMMSFFGDKENSEWMAKWKRIIVLDLKTERIVEAEFIREFDTEWDFPHDNDPYEGHFIVIELDILYNGYMDNYIIIELSNDSEIIFSNKINVFEPIKKTNDFTKSISENIINYKLIGVYGKVELAFDEKYKIRVETFFDDNLIEIRNIKLSIEKRVL